MELGRFTLDEDTAAAWLAAAVAYRDAEARGEEPSDTLLRNPAWEAPEGLTSDWNPKWSAEGMTTAMELIASAPTPASGSVLTEPESAEIVLDWSDDDDGGQFRHLIHITSPHGQLITLASYSEGTRWLIDDDDKGAEAALQLLRKTVDVANFQLEALERFASPYIGVAVMEELSNVAADDVDEDQYEDEDRPAGCICGPAPASGGEAAITCGHCAKPWNTQQLAREGWRYLDYHAPADLVGVPPLVRKALDAAYDLPGPAGRHFRKHVNTWLREATASGRGCPDCGFTHAPDANASTGGTAYG